MICTDAINTAPRLLIVDEEPAICYTLQHILDYYGYAVRATTDGTAAWSLLLQEEFDLLLIERRLPGRIDGQSLIRLAAVQQPDAVTVLLTGALDVALPRERADVRGFAAIDKTASPSAIVTCVARALAPRAEQLPKLALASTSSF